MKQFLLVVLLSLPVLSSLAQQQPVTDSTSFAHLTFDVENRRQALARLKEYPATIILLKQWVGRYNSLPKNIKPGFRHWQVTMYYNLACYNALSNNKEAALTAFEKAVQLGYNKFTAAIYDNDLASLRREKRYLAALHTIWQHSDVGAKLLSAGGYNRQLNKSLPRFTYQHTGTPELMDFKNKFKLDSVAGNGDELSRIKNLLFWVHNTVKHDGASNNPTIRNGMYLIELAKKENRGYNCRMLATILKDVYQAEGFPARVVTCMPKDSADNDCHVINVVWSQTLNKWVWMDPTFNAYVSDAKGNLLSIEEVRDKLCHSQLADLVLNNSANRNNEVPQNRD